MFVHSPTMHLRKWLQPATPEEDASRCSRPGGGCQKPPQASGRRCWWSVQAQPWQRMLDTAQDQEMRMSAVTQGLNTVMTDTSNRSGPEHCCSSCQQPTLGPRSADAGCQAHCWVVGSGALPAQQWGHMGFPPPPRHNSCNFRT